MLVSGSGVSGTNFIKILREDSIKNIYYHITLYLGLCHMSTRQTEAFLFLRALEKVSYVLSQSFIPCLL